MTDKGKSETANHRSKALILHVFLYFQFIKSGQKRQKSGQNVQSKKILRKGLILLICFNYLLIIKVTQIGGLSRKKQKIKSGQKSA